MTLTCFDGIANRHSRAGLCLCDLAIGPGGSVWALPGTDYWKDQSPPAETYVVPAEVAMAERWIGTEQAVSTTHTHKEPRGRGGHRIGIAGTTGFDQSAGRNDPVQFQGRQATKGWTRP